MISNLAIFPRDSAVSMQVKGLRKPALVIPTARKSGETL